MTYKDFTDEIRQQIFAAFSGEPENLVAVHDAFFLQAMYDVQVHVPCARSNHRTRFDHCATYFECGMTVLPQPSKYITGLFVVDRVDPETGEEDANVDLQWCAKVNYSPVQYCHISRYVKLCEKSGGLVESLTDTLSNLLFGVYRRKRTYPTPTPLADLNAARVAAGQNILPSLPEGFHYPDNATDASGRSPGGVFALHHGRIYIAPWIQSTESVVVLSNGIKTRFNPLDVIDDNPKLKQAVRLHVTHQHESAYGDPAKARDAFEQLWDKGFGAMESLRVECIEQSRVHGCNEPSSSSAVGIEGLEGNASFYNDQRVVFTATCPAGKTGTQVTVVIETNTVPSALSVSDANALAAQQAQAQATAQLICTDVVVTYASLAVTGHAACSGTGEGTPTTASLPAGARTSTVSIEAATALAQAEADALAAEQLVCTYWNTEQTATYACPSGQVQTGANGEATVPAHTFSNITQNLADADAYAEAVRLATLDFTDNGGLCNDAPPPIVYSQAQQAGPFTKQCTIIGHQTRATPSGTETCSFTVTVYVNIHAGAATGSTQQKANDAALLIASNYGLAAMSQANFCNGFTCAGGTRQYNI